MVVICPVVVRAGGPVVAVREAVPVPAPEKWTTVMKRINRETARPIYILCTDSLSHSPVSGTAPVPVPAPVAPVAGGGELVAGPGPHRLPRALP